MWILFISEEVSKWSKIDVFVRVHEGISIPCFFFFFINLFIYFPATEMSLGLEIEG